MHIFLDDERDPEQVKWIKLPDLPDGKAWKIARTYGEFIQLVQEAANQDTPIETVCFDHDLGSTDFLVPGLHPSGMHCARYLAGVVLKKGWVPPAHVVHSMNPVGKRNIELEMNDLWRQYEKSQE
jgi:hypothetical protein